MAIYGYARVSTIDQDLGIQKAALRAAGCEVVRAKKATGSRRDRRTELQVLLDFLLPPARRHVGNHSIDTGTAAGKAFLDMLGVFAEFETNLRKERELEGIAADKGRGVYTGRKAIVDAVKVRALA